MGRIISRFEEKGLNIVGIKMMRISPELAAMPLGPAALQKPFAPPGLDA